MGYIAHLTTDEAFRDEVTVHVHGTEDWRPIIYGLWSYVDGLPIDHPDLAGVLDQFEGRGEVGFIDRETCLSFFEASTRLGRERRPCCSRADITQDDGRPLSDDVEKHLAENRGRADAFFDEKIKARFVDEAIVRGEMRLRSL